MRKILLAGFGDILIEPSFVLSSVCNDADAIAVAPSSFNPDFAVGILRQIDLF